MVRNGRVALVVGAALALGAAVGGLTIVRCRSPAAEPFALDESLPDGAVTRIGSRALGAVGLHLSAMMDISPDGKRVFTVGDGSWLRVWDADSGTPLWRVRLEAPSPAPDASIVAKFAYEGLRELRDDGQGVHGVTASPDGRNVAVRIGRWIRVYEAASGSLVAERRATNPQNGDSAPVWSSDGRALWYVEKDAVTVWTLDGGARSVPVADGWHTDVLGPAPDGGAIVATRMGTPPAPSVGRISREGVWTLQRTLADTCSGADELLPDGRVRTHRHAADETRVLYRLDIDTGAAEEETSPRVGTTVYGPSGALLVCHGDAVEYFSSENASPRTLTRGGAGRIRIAADGSRVAISECGRVRLFDLPGGAPLRPGDVLPTADAFVVHPDGRRLFVGAADAKLLEIEIPSGRVLRTFDVASGACGELILSLDGNTLAGSAAGTFRVDLATGVVETWECPSDWKLLLRDRRVLSLARVEQPHGWKIVDCSDGTEVPLEGAECALLFRVSADGRFVTADLEPPAPDPNRYGVVWDTATGTQLSAALTAAPRIRLGAPAPAASEVGLSRAPWAGPPADAPIRTLGVAEALEPVLFRLKPSVDGAIAAVPTYGDDAIAIVSTADGRVLRRLRSADDGPILHAELVPGGRWLVSGHSSGCLIVWDVGSLAR